MGQAVRIQFREMIKTSSSHSGEQPSQCEMHSIIRLVALDPAPRDHKRGSEQLGHCIVQDGAICCFRPNRGRPR
jgi:hypothetical protein